MAGWQCISPTWALEGYGWPLLFYQSPPDHSTRILSYVASPDSIPQSLLDGTTWSPPGRLAPRQLPLARWT